MKMRRNRGDPRDSRRENARPKGVAGSRDGFSNPPLLLHRVQGLELSELAPGDVQMIDKAVSGSPSEPDVAPAFCAVLGCPLCGTPTLITLAQYSGTLPVMCRAAWCPGLYRILEEEQFIYMPVN